ncbi:JAM1 protein, partial [Toxostoma redivivum]|nr:JAM1 protein [Toxostoma redivivum]
PYRDRVEFSRTSIRFRSVTREDTGKYICEVVGDGSHIAKSEVNLIVQGEPLSPSLSPSLALSLALVPIPVPIPGPCPLLAQVLLSQHSIGTPSRQGGTLSLSLSLGCVRVALGSASPCPQGGSRRFCPYPCPCPWSG